MRIDTVTTEVYKFDELSDEAKQEAIDWYREGNLDYDWWEFIYEDVENIGAIFGIEIDKIYFSGFNSQGDGACFEGRYEYSKGSLRRIKEYAPRDTELHRIAKRLQQLQRKNFYSLGAEVKHRGHYYHENCTDIQVWSGNEARGGANDEAYYGIQESLRDFMRWIYKRLELEYEYLNSDKSIIENINANEYEFTVEGKIY